jgi:hypothetical protein
MSTTRSSGSLLTFGAPRYALQEAMRGRFYGARCYHPGRERVFAPVTAHIREALERVNERRPAGSGGAS